MTTPTNDENQVFREIDKTINQKPRLLSEQELDEAIILAAGKRHLHKRHEVLRELFDSQRAALLERVEDAVGKPDKGSRRVGQIIRNQEIRRVRKALNKLKESK